MATRIQVVIDCADPDSLATFWAEASATGNRIPLKGTPPGGTSRLHRASRRTN
jgi:hypothetical protein